MKLIYTIRLVVVGSFVVFLVLHLFLDRKPEEERPTCDREDCNKTTDSTEEVKIIGLACDNFYNSVCVLFSEKYKDQISNEVYKNHNSETLNILNGLDNINKPGSDSLVRRFYTNCQKLAPAEDDLKKILGLFRKSGGFPVLEGGLFSDYKWSWLETTRKLRSLGLFTDSLFTVTLGCNPLDLRNTTFYIKPPRLDLAQKDYCGKGHDCMVSFVFEFLDVVMKFGATREVAIVDGIELYSFEKELLNLEWKNPIRSKESQAKAEVTTIANLSSSFGYIDWREYFAILLGSQEYVTDDLVVVVESFGYLKDLKKVLEDTPKRLLANFVMWSVLYRLEKYIPGNRRNSLDCYNFLQNTMSYALQAVSVKTVNYGDSKAKSVVLEIATKIKEELEERVRSSEWMSVQTKSEALEKVKKMKIKVGYPKILLNSTFIDEYYRDLSLRDTALESMLSAHKFHVDKYFELCCKLVDEVFWDLSVECFLPMVYYDGVYNSIHVLEGFLQDPIFNVEMSMSEHFGRFGSIVAHEMFHALDSVGYRYDSEGKRKPFCDDPYLVELNKRSECFIDQYNSFMAFSEDILLQNPRISGEFKKLEIVADSIGLDLSFAAYKKYGKALKESDVALKDSGLTAEQRFFVSFAQFFCGTHSEGDLFQVLLDDHAPNSYRVSASLNNSEDFRKVFDCESTSTLKTCQLF